MDDEKKVTETKDTEKKQARFTRVFNPQHSRAAQKDGARGKRPDGVKGPRPDGVKGQKADGQKGTRTENGRAKSGSGAEKRQVIKPRPTETRTIIKPRPVEERTVKIKDVAEEEVLPVRPAVEAPKAEEMVTVAPKMETPVNEAPKQENVKAETKRNSAPKSETSKTDSTKSEASRQNRDRGFGRNRQDGDRARQDGERSFGRGRQDGDRARQDGERSFGRGRQDGDRARQDGERSFGRGSQDGDRPRQDGERSFGRGRQDGDRSRQDGDKPFNRGGQRPDGNRGGFGGRRDGGMGFDKDKDDNDKKDFRGGNRGGARRNDKKDGNAGIKEDAGFRQDKEDRKNRKERNRQEDKREERSIHAEKTIKNNVKKQVTQQPEEEIKMIVLPEVLTLQELASKMKLQPAALIKKLFLKGQILTLNSELDFETAESIAMDYDIICEKEVKVDAIEELLKEDEEDESLMTKRSPVVCVMGHVDHGKTSLLDAIRESNVTAREAGGITQHIGAYVVECNGEKITFLDTPGHEAFTAMRMRGAQSTDIAILVVAADDGVMPQTVEAISHAKAAGVSVIVAINKIDKPGANVERVKQELTEYDLVSEDWGGSTICVPVSAKSRIGINELLEMVLLQAEVLELKANSNRKARGLVIEAKLDKGKGSVATMLVQKGTLRVGDIIAVGSCFGKVRAMLDDRGNNVKEAGPSTPVEILGLNGVPNAGDTFVQCYNEKEARAFAETYIKDSKEKLLAGTKSRMSLDDLFDQIQAGDVKELNLIVKADVQGSVEAVRQSLTKLSNDEVVVKVIHGGVGAVNESDVTLASASNAIIIGFNVKPDNQAKDLAEREKVDLRLYKVIYNAIDDIEAAMKGLLDPVYEEKIIGHAEIRQLFKASGVGMIAGSYILDGSVQRGCKCRVTRDGEQIFDGDLASLKRFKDDVKEVKAGYECGLVFEGFNDIHEGDQVEAYIMQEVPR